jgi:hypothetical protein
MDWPSNSSTVNILSLSAPGWNMATCHEENRMRIVAILALLAGSTLAKAAGLSAQDSADIQARRGRVGHMGGSYSYEGVGFSTVSAQAAIRNCCYYGKRTPIEIAVSRGSNGWYACVRYR